MFSPCAVFTSMLCPTACFFFFFRSSEFNKTNLNFPKVKRFQFSGAEARGGGRGEICCYLQLGAYKSVCFLGNLKAFQLENPPIVMPVANRGFIFLCALGRRFPNRLMMRSKKKKITKHRAICWYRLFIFPCTKQARALAE